jgi:hypothetical protein
MALTITDCVLVSAALSWLALLGRLTLVRDPRWFVRSGVAGLLPVRVLCRASQVEPDAGMLANMLAVVRSPASTMSWLESESDADSLTSALRG